ncbi:MAG TPA: DUF4180 domain-containing protein [Rhizomicrobium sp.]|nr:DUF4180 domain-containing protein [Rhizomicrobium sp.]
MKTVTLENGRRVLMCDGMIASERDATDVIGFAFTERPDWIAIPLTVLSPAFLDLRTGFAGAILQKFVNYDFRVAILGDTSQEQARSKPLADFIRETNKGNQIWFCASCEDFVARLGS